MDFKEFIEELNNGREFKLGNGLYSIDSVQAQSKYSVFSGNYDELQYVPQLSSAFSTPEKPILATSGLSNCIGVLAYDPAKRLAFLGHTDSLSFLYSGEDKLGDPSQSAHIDKLWKGLDKRGGEYGLEISLVKGNFPDRGYIKTINTHLDRIDGTKGIKIISRREIKTGNDGSICIDSRTGQLFSYNSKLNPNPETQGAWDKLYGKK